MAEERRQLEDCDLINLDTRGDEAKEASWTEKLETLKQKKRIPPSPEETLYNGEKENRKNVGICWWS